MSTTLSPVVFIPHGGGPLPLLGDAGHLDLNRFLQALPAKLGKPAAIIVISAHWEEAQVTLSSAKTPELLYDYYGFPEAAYRISYPVGGAPELAEAVFKQLLDHGIAAKLDSRRNFDHGVFVPLKIIYPAADIPCLQLSLLNNLDAAAHIKIGRALAALRKQNILILGSGFSFHNINAFFSNDAVENAKNQAFEDWLIETCCSSKLSGPEREARLIAWRQAPFAGFCHPRAEHLLPLHVCYGASDGAAAELIFSGQILGKTASAFLWRS